LSIDYRKISETLTASLGLTQPPVAVCLLDSAPADVAPYQGRAAAGCVFWEEGAGRSFVTSPQDHSLCAIGVHTHNLPAGESQAVELGTALQIFSELGYVRAEDVPQVPVLKQSPKHVAYAPLAETPAVPDVVLLFVTAPAALIVSEACQQVENGFPPAMGRPACAAIPQVANSGTAAYSLGCCGARAYLDSLSDDRAIYALPGANIEAYAARVAALASANRVLTRFHQIRRAEVAAGKQPTIRESLEALQAQS
jgi:uncharacterized protein (DUF169 family)